MTIPIDIVAAFGAVLLTALLSSYRSLHKRMAKVERNILTVVIMLRDRGFRIPDQTDTDQFLKSNKM